MLTLHIEAATYADLVKAAQDALDFGRAEAPVVVAPTPPEPAAPQATATVDGAPAKKRGRPAKNQAPAPEAPMASVSEVQPQVTNSGSEGGGTPSPVTSPSEAPADAQKGGPPPEAGASDVKVSFEEMKAALQGVAAKRADDKSDDDGLVRASNIIGKFGYRKIKEIQPEHFAAVVVACKEAA